MDEFSRTRRGQKLFDFDLPNIAEQLQRIAAALEKKNLIEERRLMLEKKKFISDNSELEKIEDVG